MRVAIIALGRLGRGPETDLVSDYVHRAGATGRAVGLGPVELVEVEARKPGKATEGEALIAALDAFGQGSAHVIACDEHGRPLASRAFAERLGVLKDRGVRRLALLVGGADGLSPEVLQRADETLAFGPQTWPHALARVMLAEQLYRAATLLTGGPYHRD